MSPKIPSDIDKRFHSRIDELLGDKTIYNKRLVTAEFREFEKEEEEKFILRSFYEKYCSLAEKYFPFLKPGDKTRKAFEEEIEISALNITPEGIYSAAILTALFSIFTAVPFYILGAKNFAFFMFATGVFLAYVCYTYPNFRAQIIKIQVQQESLLALLYMTIYLKVNPVLENAVYFSAQHLTGPFGRDLKRMLWLLESGKVSTIEEATNYFMPLWVKRNPDFVKAFIILRNVLTQSDEESENRILNKSLDSLLNDTYERMKHFSHELATPVMVLQTFGMMLPLIGLIAFPMISVFMADQIKISYLFFGYIVVLPALLFFFTSRIISKRPGAFSHPDITNNPYVPPKGKYLFNWGGKQYLVPILPISIAVAIILMLPGIIHVFTGTIPAYFQGQSLGANEIIPADCPGSPSPLAREYMPWSMFITLTIPLGLALGLIVYFYLSSVQRIKIRTAIIEIEDDLGEALFNLGNQFSERIPVEMAIRNFIIEYDRLNLKKGSTYTFFSLVLGKMQTTGTTLKEAIFNSREGVLIKYPSILLKEIVWIITEGAKKGTLVLYNVTTKISAYLGSVKKIKELLYDLLAETVSSINIQAKFLAPFLAAVVGSLTFIIVRALWLMTIRLQEIMRVLSLGTGNAGDFFAGIFQLAHATPPTMFQIMVGIYLVEAVFLLSILANGVEAGFDPVSRDMTIAKNIMVAMIVFTVVSLMGVFILQNLASTISGGELITGCGGL